VLAAYLKHFRDVRSFRDLANLMADKATRHVVGLNDRDLLDSKALEVTVNRLAGLNVLNLREEDLKDRPEVYANRINLPDVFTTPQVIYFYLSAPQEPKTVSMIGKLALFTLLSAAAQSPTSERRQVYIFADEFQRLLSQNLEIFFEQARSMKLSFILANQDLSQLKNKGVSILSLVESCTAYKQIFTAPDEDTIKLIERLSGDALYHKAQWQERIDARIDPEDDDVFDIRNAPAGTLDQVASVRITEDIGPRLDLNTIIEVSADPFGSFVRFAQNSGFTRFSGFVTPIISEYHISEAEYGSRATWPWPVESSDTVLVTKEEQSEAKAAGEGTPPVPLDPGEDVYDLDQSIEARLDRA
jgi:hypothetical protein